ncbi:MULTISPECIES: hypothetical protein [Streptomycetaceae]|uniref:hypothetical protein n=1 Tax=Streptomycetaceae TaxID=2062 RepID=UPI0011611F1A|nr:hypothetical protein [Streptomyces sp. CB02056]
MTTRAATPRAPRLVGLHVVFATKVRAPYADYLCPCGHRDAALGAAAVIRLVQTTGPAHLTTCPLSTKDRP